MLTTLVDEHVDAEALNVNGEVTSVLLEGLLTTTPARAGTVMVMAITEARVRFRARFIDFPLRLKDIIVRGTGLLVQPEAGWFFICLVGMSEMRALSPTSNYSATSDHDVAMHSRLATVPGRFRPNLRSLSETCPYIDAVLSMYRFIHENFDWAVGNLLQCSEEILSQLIASHNEEFAVFLIIFKVFARFGKIYAEHAKSPQRLRKNSSISRIFPNANTTLCDG